MGVLNRQENEVMNAVYRLCDGRGVCLVSPDEITNLLPPKKGYDEQQIERILGALALDDYFQLLSSERKGEKMYVISLRANGYAYKRSFVQRKRDFIFKLGWAVASAVIAFLVGLLLKRIF